MNKTPNQSPASDSDLSMLAGSVSFERLDKYHLKLSAAYGPNPTEYQSGVMMGIGIARGFAASKIQNK